MKTTNKTNLRAALRTVAARLHHAADLAQVCAGGSMPDRGAEHVIGILADVAPELRVLRAARPAKLD